MTEEEKEKEVFSLLTERQELFLRLKDIDKRLRILKQGNLAKRIYRPGNIRDPYIRIPKEKLFHPEHTTDHQAYSMNPEHQVWAMKLREKRISRKMTQEALGQLLGIPRYHVCEIETCRDSAFRFITKEMYKAIIEFIS